MNRFKKMAVLFLSIFFVFSFSACSNGNVEYESTQGFEFHFCPEEYDEEYNEVSKTLSLEADTDYQLQIDAACDSGTLEIRIMYKGTDEKVFAVSADMPCNELLAIPANTTDEITITVSITPNTKGEIIGDMLAPAK